ncbi:MAG: septation regulator SpoVG [Clostridia bacterium]|jgi:stage V sporulation protein G|nr:septation regulator SpoVG [Clostridia bacterium]
MNITDIRIRKINHEGKMKAVVSITFDDSFVVHDVKVVEGTNGLFVAMPSRKTPDGEYRDIAHPISTDAREVIQTAVLKAYEEAAAI